MTPFPGDFTSTANGALILAVALAAYTAFAAQSTRTILRTIVATLPFLLLLLVAYDRNGPLWLAVLMAAMAAATAFAVYRITRLPLRPYAGAFILMAVLTVWLLG